MTRLTLLVSALLGLAPGVGSAAGATERPLELPPLLQPAERTQHPGKMIWADLATPDLASAERFYGGLFGWTFQAIHSEGGEYTVAMLDGAPVAGLVQKAAGTGQRAQPAWLTFLSVRSVHETSRKITAKGGRMVAPPRSYRNRGSQAVYADPQGAVFAIMHSTSGDPPDVIAAPGEWIWSVLLTHHSDEEAGFYQKTLRYDVFELPDDGGTEHLELASEKMARGLVSELPTTATQHSHWVNFVRVANINDAVAKAKALGGRVLVEPHQDRQGEPVALLADPAGAPIGVLEWREQSSQEAAK